ncbi:MAG: acyltransferase family protein [Marinosulfonomonas sp.]
MATMVNPIHARDSAAIRVTRVLCIFFMISVHIPGAYGVSYVLQGDGAIFGDIWIRILGRASVAVLSLVSGFLLVGALEKCRPVQVLRDRFRVLIVPMIAWNLILLFLVFVATVANVQGGQALPAATPLAVVNAVTGFFGASFNSPLSFLRDLFVSSILILVFWQLIREHLTLALGVVLVLAIFDFTAPIVFRSTILLFMLAGCSLRVNQIQLSALVRIKPLFLGVLCGSAVYLVSAHAGMDVGPIAEIENIAKRVVLVFFMIALAVAIGQNRMAQAVADRFAPVVFLAYLSHVILGKLIWIVMSALGVDVMGPSYLIFFFAAPALIFILCLPMRWFVDLLPAPIPVLVKGKPSRTPWSVMPLSTKLPFFPAQGR